MYGNPMMSSKDSEQFQTRLQEYILATKRFDHKNQ